MKHILLIGLLLPLQALSQSKFSDRIEKVAAALQCPPPDGSKPVTVNAAVVATADSLAVIVKSEILRGWHIYAYVPENQPYIQLDPILETPASLQPAGGWSQTPPTASVHDPGVLIYNNTAVFIRKFARKEPSGGKIKAGLYFQCCDIKQCLPPDEHVVELNF
ncbi:hypothetical protein [Chitinophaga caseinilytica]|uniref:hypothetical protein n=1 Tax=Chitinophaga caseinilytica TaxID=2267521 RepID=UPI003C2E7639